MNKLESFLKFRVFKIQSGDILHTTNMTPRDFEELRLFLKGAGVKNVAMICGPGDLTRLSDFDLNELGFYRKSENTSFITD